MTLTVPELHAIAENQLDPVTRASLPDVDAPAPWRAKARAIAWSSRPRGDARELVTELLRPLGPDAVPLSVAGALLSYSSTPVGTYNEIMAVVVYRQAHQIRCHTPFIAVDSLATLVGGRVNWSLPKILADFDGEPAPGTRFAARTPTLSISATAHASRLTLPWVLPPLAPMIQVGDDGARVGMRLKGYGFARRAHVTVETTGSEIINALLPSGTYGSVFVSSATGFLGTARPMPA